MKLAHAEDAPAHAEDAPPILEEQLVGIRGPLPDGRYSYVAVDGALRVYDIDRNYSLVRRITLPTRYRFVGIRGIAADARADRLYRHLHVFDVRGLPVERPRQIADIQLGEIPKWINFTRDGRYAHVSTGEIVNRRSRKVVAVAEASRQFLQIDWRASQPVRAYSRYGLGYGDRSRG